MVDRGHKPGALAVSHTTDIGHAAGVSIKSDRVKLSLSSGESAEILLHGATVISWKAGGEEKLFLSDKAVLGTYLSSISCGRQKLMSYLDGTKAGMLTI